MKNSEFLDLLVTLGKINEYDFEFFRVDKKIADASVFNIKRYYDIFENKVKNRGEYDLGALMSSLCTLTYREYDKDTEDLIFNVLDFIFEVMDDKSKYTDIMDNFVTSTYGYKKDDFYNIEYISYVFGKRIRLNGVRYKLNVVSDDENDALGVLIDRYDNIVNNHVVSIEKDLKTGKIYVSSDKVSEDTGIIRLII